MRTGKRRLLCLGGIAAVSGIWPGTTTNILAMAAEGIYLDTSGLLAVMDADDECHSRAAPSWQELVRKRVALVMTDYVRLECWALVQRRLGLEALRDFQRGVLSLCEIDLVGEAGFALLAQQTILANRRDLSLVDVSSFDCMERRGFRHAFAFDKHFGERGFVTPEDPDWPYSGAR